MQFNRINAVGIRCVAALSLLLLGTIADAGQEKQQSVNEIGTAIAAGEANVHLRYRYEFVDQESFAKDASASTLLLRLNYKTGGWNKWSGFLEFDHVMNVFSTSFNSAAGTSSPRRDAYPVVADPKGPDLNQLYFQYKPDDEWQFKIGRQRIILDDQRYVGGVGWRQNEQTYDSLSLNWTGAPNTNVFYSYVVNANRIFGTTVPAGDNRQDTHLLNVRYGEAGKWTVGGFAYLIDNDDVAAFSTATLGLRASGSVKAGDGKIDLFAELATQSDYGNNPAAYDTEYLRLQGIWTLNAFSAGIGFESLGSDNGQGFVTPLATLHVFNGWADQFLGTPGTGIEDTWFRAGYKSGKWALQLIYHDFAADVGSQDYGTELDLSAARPLSDRYSLLLKFADFRADSLAFQDTTKFWLMLTANY